MKFIENFYLKLPSLPNDLKEFVVKMLPILSLIFGILIVIAAVIDLFGTPILSAFSMNGGSDFIRGLLVTNTLGVIQGAMMILAFQPLRMKKMLGWKLLFLAQVVWIISSLITLSPWFLISLLLFYPYFQVKSHYR